MQTNTQKILLEWKDEVTQRLVEGFRHLFDSSSQVLLEFADAAENNRLQRLFFDAQREFYLKEETIVGEFERSLRENLLNFPGVSNPGTKLGADTLDCTPSARTFEETMVSVSGDRLRLGEVEFER